MEEKKGGSEKDYAGRTKKDRLWMWPVLFDGIKILFGSSFFALGTLLIGRLVAMAFATFGLLATLCLFFARRLIASGFAAFCSLDAAFCAFLAAFRLNGMMMLVAFVGGNRLRSFDSFLPCLYNLSFSCFDVNHLFHCNVWNRDFAFLVACRLVAAFCFFVTCRLVTTFGFLVALRLLAALRLGFVTSLLFAAFMLAATVLLQGYNHLVAIDKLGANNLLTINYISLGAD